ncbi:malto-oligosyltrehalose synthase [Piscinibacter sp.]|uniref:malto-oligosyltrehalose synthase n=1 Tax=Piscinibacter sp. TaxID=1903157 RepID=UPI002BF77CC5|nr:malto-oligosyltrehalose synthase [Albitalea sp.]HUG24049.1 malto-oligosyltrehalose synthase [Albitalea sp.]
MPERRAALERLCRRFGIATDYHDIWGTRHAVPDDNLIALLAAFDVDAGSQAAVAAADQAAEAALWRRALPPVAAVAASDSQWSLALRLPRSFNTLRWTLAEEGGARHTGEAEAASLPSTAQGDRDGTAWRECRLAPGVALPAGYHRFSVDGCAGDTLLIAAPPRCYRPPALGDNGRVWGPAVQVYALRSERQWGMGDFGDLARLAEQAAARGADIVGLNPMHALFAHNPAHASPYSPSSRLRLNVLYVDVEAIEDFRECDAAQRRVRSAEFQSRLARLRDAEFVDYPGVAAAKFEILELLYAHFREHHLAPGTPRGAAFRAFQRDRGQALHRHAIYEALQAHFHAADASVWGWPKWPPAYHDPESDAVARFAQEQLERVEYHAYLQWQADRQLARAAEHCRVGGLAIGLYLDLAVSVDRAGSDTWAHQDCYALGASVGAPSDEFNPAGQAWGLPPLRPDRLREHGYGVFIETLRETMRHAGAVRIDHVMGLMRLFWIPPERSARDGAYVHYAADELLAIVALESERNRCMVIGEDLGTVADEMRTMLAHFEVLSYRLLYFERGDGGAFRPSADYPRGALVAISTHDLPTLAGWWTGRDLQVRLDLGLYPSRDLYEKQLVDRAQERVRLLLALQHEGLLPEGTAVESLGTQALTPALVEAIHAFVAATPSRVMVVQMEDVLGVAEQANMPGTTLEHPNWNRKLPATLAELDASAGWHGLAGVLAKIRPHAGPRAAAASGTEARVPRATYRLQLNKEFTFEDAEKILPYLARLGVSHVYCSPILRARPGSMHGYDIVAHDEINPELGGADGFVRFTEALRRHGLGQLVDIVPNHMGVLGADNAWWMDVLENGAASAYARYFDIEWHPVNADLDGKVLVPALGGHYGDVLASGELTLAFESESGALALRYHEHRFPLDPRSYPVVLERAASMLNEAPVRDALSSVAAAFGHLPGRDATDPEAVAERARDKEVHKARLQRLAARDAAVAQAIGASVAELNAGGSQDELHELLEVQAWRLAYWRVASDEINYRRFFDINGLAALRMEDEQVFEATHAFTLELAASGAVDGLRIDHPDGLYDPARYFRRLQEGYARRVGVALPEHDAAGRPARPLYVVAEKIVAPHEAVPATWHLHGTTGYRFAMVAGGVLVDASAQARFDRIWRTFVHENESFEEMAYQGKRAIQRSALASELTMLSTELLRIARADRRTRDYTFNTLRLALAEIAACMPVYRTYIAERASEQDLRYVNWAVAQARRRSRAADVSIFDFARRSLLGQAVEGAGDELQARVRRFAIHFQQFTSPVAAKGVEDTAFYRYSRLVSLNEVGGDPGQFGMTVRAFHGASADRAAHWPHTMLATSTHDNKRSEDVRHRISVLSETPAAWRLALRRWSRINRMHRSTLDDGRVVPSPADEYLLYQTLLGTWPAGGLREDALANYRERIQQYMLKAAREAKTHTGWVSPDEAYENGLLGFVGGLLGRLSPNLFLDDLAVQAQQLAWFGALNGLTVTLLKFTSPGVPDIYQGHELISLALVDPDNRRPVDCEALAGALASLEALAPQQVSALAANPHNGRAKLWIAWRLLTLRRERPALFRDGAYAALEAHGTHAEHVLAFARRHEGTTLLVIAGRLFARLLGEAERLPLGEAVWADTTVAVDLPDGTRLTDVLCGETRTVEDGHIALGAAFARFPAAAFVTS